MPSHDDRPAAATDARKSVLLVDDDPLITRAVARLLTIAGYDVVATDDGASAVAALRERAFDCVLSDIEMPGMSGVELLGEVRRHDLDVPVVLMTGAPRLETAIDAVELGALQYLLKPSTPEAIVRAVERAVRVHGITRLERALRAQVRAAPGEDLEALRASLDRALETLWVAFQPIVRAADRGVFGYEALLRSREPALPHPGAVLDAAERLGRLPELGARVRALAAEAFTAAPDGAVLFLNVHPRDLLDAALYEPRGALAACARRVVLEITERAGLDAVRDVGARVVALRAQGHRLAIDDLGAGYAGLASFARLEPEIVKLDMSLVRAIDRAPIQQRLVASVVALCRELGMSVVAEGVETREEFRVIAGLGCELVQGYLFARPGPAFPAVEPL